MADISIKGHSPILRQGYKKGGSGYHTTKEGKKARKVFGTTFIKKEKEVANLENLDQKVHQQQRPLKEVN